ncbi:peptide-N4-(N-acetyl-beta-glucosaminyl)asparagine amidase A-like [Phoenix dactylifera]|uniref:Peptide-N4-(N-acetyl-beta- glucosaminyl)asparagine amidase A-like n=1 Tax=Phoenix dactylifera TaxID=42345 RepID=A0A8B7CTC0_PHODC|nr:peptide-N4-(N-acetyl-beta-glucosaminyl)asparagine amidase A-like [Phoenix dactylifera]
MSANHHHLRANSLLPALLFFLLFMGCSTTASPPSLSTSFPFPPPPAAPQNTTLEYMDPTLPPLIPTVNPKCSTVVLREDFADTLGFPPASVDYAPPADCPAPWSRVILELSATASDVQMDRIAAIWVDGAEILRTSTPLPMAPGVFWHVRKDVTRYTAVLRSATTFSMMLENSNATLPGVYSVNVSLHFYRGALSDDAGRSPSLKLPTNAHANGQLGSGRLSAHPTIKGLYREPADLIIPISNELGDCGPGSWFKIRNESDVQLTTVLIPNNTYRAVLEIYVSHHGDDEYWYANPLRTNGPRGGLTSPSSKANGGFRQVVVTIDKRFAGAVVPFPVIYPGSINPFFWAPVAALGAYDHPSYDLDLTPFVGKLLDGPEHHFGLTVRDSQPYWLVSANLHLWLDAWSDGVEGALVRYKVPPLKLSRQAAWRDLDGKSSIDGQVIIRFSGWVSSSKGNITTSVKQRLKFKSRVEVHRQGSIKQASMEVKSRTNVRTEKNHKVIGRVQVETEAPLMMETMSSNGGGGSVFEKTKMYHKLQETTSVAVGKEVAYSTMTDRQDSEGSALMEDRVAKWGSGDTESTYKYRDDKACHLRTVIMVGGTVRDDAETASCVSVLDS